MKMTMMYTGEEDIKIIQIKFLYRTLKDQGGK